MMRIIFDRGVQLSLMVIVLSASLLFAQQPPPAEPPPNNTFTMTTYYPAPFGAYKKLTVSDSVGIGTTAPACKQPGAGKSCLNVQGAGIQIEDANNWGSNWGGTLFFQKTSTGKNWQINIDPGDGLNIAETEVTDYRLKIAPGGNVGIGTASPGVKLHVLTSTNLDGLEVEGSADNTSVYLKNNAAGGAAWRIDSSGGTSGWGQGKFTIIKTGASTPTVTLDRGNVGIGTTGPNAPLDVFKSNSSATNNPGNPAIRVTATTGANSKFLSLGYDATLNKGYIQAAQAGVAWQDLLLNPKGGNVGIGTTEPQVRRCPDGTLTPSIKLGVFGNALFGRNGSAATYISDGGNGYDTGNFVIWTNADDIHQVSIGQSVPAGGGITNDMIFSTFNGGPWVERMRLTNAGNVGIGTASPDHGRLHVNGSIASAVSSGNPMLRVSRIGLATGWMLLDDSYNTLFASDVTGGAGFIFKTGVDAGQGPMTSGTEVMRILGNGNVGIGTTSPTQKLDVSGNIYASGTVTWGGSDQRLKQNIHPLTDTLQTIEDIHGVSFEWNQLAESLIGRKSGQKDIGLIAQEVQKFYPELVTIIKGKGQEEYLNLDYSRFTAILLEAIKELKSRFETEADSVRELKTEIESLKELKGEVESLREKIKILEKK